MFSNTIAAPRTRVAILSDRDDGLRPVPVVEWHGMIFVCPSIDPPDFHRQLELLTTKLASHLPLLGRGGPGRLHRRLQLEAPR